MARDCARIGSLPLYIRVRASILSNKNNYNTSLPVPGLFSSFLSLFTFSAHKWSAGRINSDIVGIVQYSCYTTWITLVAIIPPCSRASCEWYAGRATDNRRECSN